MSILDEIASHRAAVAAQADDFLTKAEVARQTTLAEMTAFDAALSDSKASFDVQRAKLAQAIDALTALNLAPPLDLTKGPILLP